MDKIKQSTVDKTSKFSKPEGYKNCNTNTLLVNN